MAGSAIFDRIRSGACVQPAVGRGLPGLGWDQPPNFRPAPASRTEQTCTRPANRRRGAESHRRRTDERRTETQRRTNAQTHRTDKQTRIAHRKHTGRGWATMQHAWGGEQQTAIEHTCGRVRQTATGAHAHEARQMGTGDDATSVRGRTKRRSTNTAGRGAQARGCISH